MSSCEKAEVVRMHEGPVVATSQVSSLSFLLPLPELWAPPIWTVRMRLLIVRAVQSIEKPICRCISRVPPTQDRATDKG